MLLTSSMRISELSSDFILDHFDSSISSYFGLNSHVHCDRHSSSLSSFMTACDFQTTKQIGNVEMTLIETAKVVDNLSLVLPTAVKFE